MMQTLHFTKMHGLGNDYIYFNVIDHPLPNPNALSVTLSDRHTGIGGDGIVLIGKSSAGDFSMRIFNADGSEAKMCGNASRCIGKYLYDKGLTDKKVIRLDTLSGIKTLNLHVDDTNKVDTVDVDMGEGKLLNLPDGTIERDTVTAFGQKFTATAIDMGNPHLVLFVNNAETVDVANIGASLETNPKFPGGINVEFVQVIDRNHIRMRVWERGSGITKACGTGACASAVACAMANLTEPEKCIVKMDGGDLKIMYNTYTKQVKMSGTANTVFEGEITIQN
ncbi:MAG: diaminopimelate epimerase [Bacteroidales bacterium]|nr:diaminopimelate epimerase [Bacteroidales bacterium]